MISKKLSKFQHPGKLFRQLVKSESCLMVPGVFNGLTARIAAQKGYKSLYVSGGATSAASGVPDIGLLSMQSFTKVIKQAYNSTKLPIIADADTGFGEAQMSARTVWQYNNAGAAGLHIEDQVFPKRCGHLDGKTLVTIEDMLHKIRIAKQASQECSNGDFIICARTDAAGIEGIDASIKRAIAYIDAGADMIFPQGLKSEEQFIKVAKELKSYSAEIMLLANMTEFGKTPMISFNKFKQFGYDCVIYPVSSLRIAMKAVEDFFDGLQKEGSVEFALDKMMTRSQLYDKLKYKPGKQWYYPSSSTHDNASQNKE